MDFGGADLEVGEALPIDLTAVATDILPDANNTHDIGEVGNTFKDIHAASITATTSTTGGTSTTDTMIVNNRMEIGAYNQILDTDRIEWKRNNQNMMKLYYDTVGGSGVLYPTVDQGMDLGISGTNEFDNVYCTALFESSDREKKEDIMECSKGLEFISKLKPSEYKYKRNVERGDHTIYTGFIAQDVEDLMAEENYEWGALKKVSHVDEITGEAKPETYNLNYSSFIAPLVKSINELSSLTRLNQTSLMRLRERISALEE